MIEDPEPEPDPYLVLTDTDPGGQKTNGYESGSSTLLNTHFILSVHVIKGTQA
jgi:hypothetical protein